MALDALVCSIMTPRPATVAATDSLATARARMFERRAHHLPVVYRDELVGMLSSADLRCGSSLDFFADASEVAATLGATTVGEVMTTDVVTVRTTDPLWRLVDLFSIGSFHGVPVVDQDDRLVGMVTTTDLVRYMGACLGRGRAAQCS